MYEPNEYDLELMTEFSDDGKNENENEIIEFYNYNYGFDYLEKKKEKRGKELAKLFFIFDSQEYKFLRNKVYSYLSKSRCGHSQKEIYSNGCGIHLFTANYGGKYTGSYQCGRWAGINPNRFADYCYTCYIKNFYCPRCKNINRTVYKFCTDCYKDFSRIKRNKIVGKGVSHLLSDSDEE